MGMWGKDENTTDIVDFHGFLDPNDSVAISFWIISISMVAATVFFLMESRSVMSHWVSSLHVGALVTLVAAVHYFYMREYWITMHGSPILYRYIDWSITVPLQMVEFYIILSAVKNDLNRNMFWRLLGGTVLMLLFGYLGETAIFPSENWFCFIFGMLGWFFILLEIFGLDECVARLGVKEGKFLEGLRTLEQKIGLGEAGTVAETNLGIHIRNSYKMMRLIVTLGWSIYPLGYLVGYLILGHKYDAALNFIYNIADFVNKIAFCLAIWHCAKKSSLGHEPWDKLQKYAQMSSNSPRVEAALKLISNYERVVADATNPSPITQSQLQRVSLDCAEYVEQLLREVARNLIGLPALERAQSGNAKQAQAWQGCAAYFSERTQATGQQCPGRAADMSQEAAQAFITAVKEVASGADGGKTQTLLP
jgi:bacteriorhodopsin